MRIDARDKDAESFVRQQTEVVTGRRWLSLRRSAMAEPGFNKGPVKRCTEKCGVTIDPFAHRQTWRSSCGVERFEVHSESYVCSEASCTCKRSLPEFWETRLSRQANQSAARSQHSFHSAKRCSPDPRLSLGDRICAILTHTYARLQRCTSACCLMERQPLP